MKKTRDAVPKPEETQLCVLHGLRPDLLKLADPCRYALCSCGSYTRAGKLGSSWPFMLTNAGWRRKQRNQRKRLSCLVTSSHLTERSSNIALKAWTSFSASRSSRRSRLGWSTTSVQEAVRSLLMQNPEELSILFLSCTCSITEPPQTRFHL